MFFIENKAIIYISSCLYNKVGLNFSFFSSWNIFSKIFYSSGFFKILEFISYLSNLKNNKSAYEKINHLFKKDNIIYALNDIQKILNAYKFMIFLIKEILKYISQI